MKKSLIAIIMTTVMMLSLAAPLISILPVSAAVDPSGWYMTVPGVLDSDYYVLYPYEKNSLTIGFSKFGEMINSDGNVGLQYGDTDPFAPPAGASITSILKNRWLQGWFINITYNHRIQGPRNVWAEAMFSDGIEYGRDWLRVDFMSDRSSTYGVEDPRDPGALISASPYTGLPTLYGGRKTNGTAVTQNIKVLYDGPREFIGETRTKVYDHFLFQDNTMEGDVPLVEVVLTFVFDKVKKEVNVLKDVKSLLPLKEGEKMKIEFSNRGEVDLGTVATNFASYAHFYTQGTATLPAAPGNDVAVEGLSTVYNADWELIQTETPEYRDTQYEYANFSAAGPFPQTSETATYDVAQVIHDPTGTANDYVWYAAFWPSVSDWSIDGWEQWWHSLKAYDPHYIDLRPTIGEPSIPFYIGEWDFVLYYDGDPEVRTQFRGVTQYGVVNRHDGNDAQIGGSNKIDTEVLYYTNQAFNPWDLEQAVHKNTVRYLEWKKTSSTSFTTNAFNTPVLVVPATAWDDYGVFSERVVDYSTGKLVPRAGRGYGTGGYTLTLNADGTATFTGLPTSTCKILYSVLPYEYYEDDGSWAEAVNENNTELADMSWNWYDSSYDVFEREDTLRTTHTISIDDIDVDVTVLQNSTSFDETLTSDEYDLYGWAEDFKVFKGEETTISWDAIDYNGGNPLVLEGDNFNVSLNEFDLHWFIEAPLYRDVDLSYLEWDGTLTVNVEGAPNGPVEFPANFEVNVTATITIDFYYYEWARGQYEWIEVGRDAASVDSAGAALVSAAFKNKQVEIGIAGVDMAYADVANSMPNIMAKFGAGTAVADYKDAKLRAALADDWCTTWPVASSNIAGVGGPLANVFSYYANDFTSAFYGLSQFTQGSAYSDKITGIPCWNRAWDINGNKYNVYSSNSTVGYAVIATTLDINATELFTVWGNWGRDTYYATQWLYGDEARDIPPGIHQLQEAPAGVTSLIIEIDYKDAKHPTFKIVEVLGTKTEREWIHEATNGWNDTPFTETKGGIHDP